MSIATFDVVFCMRLAALAVCTLVSRLPNDDTEGAAQWDHA